MIFPTPLPIARYRFTFRVTEAIRLPDYAGSTLRGGFGHALRQLACVVPQMQCAGCSLIDQCPYPQIFAPHDIPRKTDAFSTIRSIPVPYIIEPPSRGETHYETDSEITFCMVLMGKALQQLPIIILAWRRAFLRGISKTRGKAELITVDWMSPDGTAKTVYSEQSPVIAPHSPALSIPVDIEKRDFYVHFVTPLRLQHQGKILGAREMNPAILLRNLIRRVSLLLQFHLGQTEPFPMESIRAFNALADSLEDKRRLAWRNCERYSSRQRQKTPLSGLEGYWLLRNLPVELFPFLYLGQWLHVGKETMFGLGHYRLVNEGWKYFDTDLQNNRWPYHTKQGRHS
ncbi:MAG: CRISPR system precrRNA processing endoribonuclease RAMP protein Cas6 [Exilibacterium sp.]